MPLAVFLTTYVVITLFRDYSTVAAFKQVIQEETLLQLASLNNELGPQTLQNIVTPWDNLHLAAANAGQVSVIIFGEVPTFQVFMPHGIRCVLSVITPVIPAKLDPLSVPCC